MIKKYNEYIREDEESSQDSQEELDNKADLIKKEVIKIHGQFHKAQSAVLKLGEMLNAFGKINSKPIEAIYNQLEAYSQELQKLETLS